MMAGSYELLDSGVAGASDTPSHARENSVAELPVASGFEKE